MPVKKDLSILGALFIVASQIYSSIQSSDKITKEIEKFRSEFNQSVVERNEFFARKSDLASITRKIDLLGVQMTLMDSQVRGLKIDRPYPYSDYRKGL